MATQKRLFLAGGSGLLALNWALLSHDTWDVFLGLHKRKINPPFASSLYLMNPCFEGLISLLKDISPQLVINTAALTNVEYCELRPDLAHEVNVNFAQQLASACNDLKIPLVHISTDHLFDGESSFACETTAPSPLNVYAKTKAEAEIKVLECCKHALVIRTNFYGWGTSYRHSVSDNIINSLKNKRAYNAFDDVYFTPILISDLICAIHLLLEAGARGVFNVVSDQRLSKYEFSVLVAKAFGLQTSLLKPISIHDMPSLVRRPKDMSLSSLKVQIS